MISFITPESQFPMFDTPDIAAQIQKAHMQFTKARLMEALIARFGELPSDEEIRAHCIKAVGPDNVTHFIWVDVKPEIGEKIDFSGLLCSIEPPKIFDPNKPHR